MERSRNMNKKYQITNKVTEVIYVFTRIRLSAQK